MANKYYYKTNDLNNFLNGTNKEDSINFTGFPGSNVLTDATANANDAILRPLALPFKNGNNNLNSYRYAKYKDFYETTIGAKQLLSTHAPAGTSHVSGILIGGGGGGGCQGGGNNPLEGSSRSGSGGGGGGSGAQVFFYNYPYSSNFSVQVGQGGDAAINGLNGQIYKNKGNTGGFGYNTILFNNSNNTSNNTPIFMAEGGKGGEGGDPATANANAQTVGDGGVAGVVYKIANASFYTPTATCTKNSGVTGQNGSVWNGSVASGGIGGDLSRLTTADSDYPYGRGGTGGTSSGVGSGAGANNGYGSTGNNGFARIYYLIE